MKKRNRLLLKGQRGAAVLFAIALTAMLATGALAIDLGMLFTAKAEAQRVADAAALAGASAYKEHFANMFDADTAGIARGTLYATENTIRGTKVDAANVVIEMDTAAFTATAWVRSPALGTWMARTLGISSAIVQARAKAWFAPVGGVKCVKPFAIPDLWEETNTVFPPPSGTTQQDGDSDRNWGNDEGWVFEPADGDRYEQWSPSDPLSTTATGYHSNWRNVIGAAPPFDLGNILTIKSQQPATSIASGFFYPWRIGSSSGANDYKDNITGCNQAGASVGVPYDIENGNMVGPTRQAINEVMASDAAAAWDQATLSVVGSSHTDWRDSPRVIIAGLFDPNQIAGIQGAGNLTITFNNFALFFLEGIDDSATHLPPPQRPVLARFIGFAQGSDEGAGPSGPLNRRLRLIE